MIDGFQRAGLCRGNFFIFKILEGSSHCLERFWARYPISRAEWAGQPFSVVAAWRPFKRAKPAAWDPPPGLGIRVHSAPSFDERNAFMIENGSLVLSDRFVLTKAMSGSASPSPSMMK